MKYQIIFATLALASTVFAMNDGASTSKRPHALAMDEPSSSHDAMAVDEPSSSNAMEIDGASSSAGAAASSGDTVKLKTSDEKIIEVPKNIAEMSATLTTAIEDQETPNEVIPVKQVDAATLEKVIQYSKEHVKLKAEFSADPVKEKKALAKFDNDFIKTVDNPTLFQLILAANYLNIKSLLDLGVEDVASMIKGKRPQEIRTMFNIQPDFTPEELVEIEREDQWAFK